MTKKSATARRPLGNALVPEAVGRALAAALPHAGFQVSPGCGHLPTLEKPAESAEMFATLLKTAEAHAS